MKSRLRTISKSGPYSFHYHNIITSTLSSSQFSYILAMPPTHSHQGTSSFDGFSLYTFLMVFCQSILELLRSISPIVRIGSTSSGLSKSDLSTASYPVTLLFLPLTPQTWWNFCGEKQKPAVETSESVDLEPLPPHTWISLSASALSHPIDIKALEYWKMSLP